MHPDFDVTPTDGFGFFADPATGSVNDANNPRHFIMPEDGTISSISLYVKYDTGQLAKARMGI